MRWPVVPRKVCANCAQLRCVCTLRELQQNVHIVAIYDVLQCAFAQLLEVVDHELVRRLRSARVERGRKEEERGAREWK